MTDEAVQRLLDTEELKKLKYRYFRLMDAKEWDKFTDLFTEDLEMNFAFPDEQFYPAGATITPEGWARVDRDGLLDWVRSVSEGFTTLHLAHMPDIEFTGPDTATGTWSMTDYTRWDASGDPTWNRSYGGHVEDYVRTAEGWKIRRSIFSRHDFDVVEMTDEHLPTGRQAVGTPVRDQLADRLEIDDLLTRYGVAIDTKNFELLDTVFTQDALIDYSQTSGMKGHYPEMKKWMADVVSPFSMTQHMVVNRDVKLDGDVAHVRCYLFNPMGLQDGNGAMTLFFVGGYYNERCVRTPDGWRIAERVTENVWLNGTVPESIIGRSGRGATA